jgi:hypothetical protein
MENSWKAEIISFIFLIALQSEMCVEVAHTDTNLESQISWRGHQAIIRINGLSHEGIIEYFHFTTKHMET